MSPTSPTGLRRSEPAQEEQVVGVLVADAGEVALVEQGDEDRHLGWREQAAAGLVGIPVGAEQVGAEVADRLLLVARGSTSTRPS